MNLLLVVGLVIVAGIAVGGSVLYWVLTNTKDPEPWEYKPRTTVIKLKDCPSCSYKEKSPLK